MITGTNHFPLKDFKHPELINQEAFDLLNCIRKLFDRPMVITDDARLPGDIPPGGSTTSLHFKGQAFDIRSRNWNPVILYDFVDAVMIVASWVRNNDLRAPHGHNYAGIELEIVNSSTDKHVHIGFMLDGSLDELLIRAE